MASALASQNTRDAVLVHGLALLAAITTVVLAIILRPGDQAFAPALGVSLGATGIFIIWSLTLAVRGWRRGDRSRWARAMLVLGVLELAAIGLVILLIELVVGGWDKFLRLVYGTPHWSAFIEWLGNTGLIVFLPVGGIACLIATPVTWWLMRRASRKDAQAGIQERSHWKRSMAWFCVVTVLLLALLLPCPLFLYCAGWDNYNFYQQLFSNRLRASRGVSREESSYDIHTQGWRKWVLEHTPVFVGDAAAGAVSLFSPNGSANLLYVNALKSGRVSKRRLLAEVYSTGSGPSPGSSHFYFTSAGLRHSTDSTPSFCAMVGLERGCPREALALAESIGQDQVSETTVNMRAWAGRVVGWNAPPERIRFYLNQPVRQWSPQHCEFMNYLVDSLRYGPEFLPDLISFCRKDTPAREVALYKLARMLPEKDLPRVWAEWVADTDALRRQMAIRQIRVSVPLNARFAILAAVLENPDPAIRQDGQQCLDEFWFGHNSDEKPDPALVKRLVQNLLPVLDDSALSVRRGAARGLAVLLCHPAQTFFDDLLPLSAPMFRPAPRPETPQEVQMLEAVRAAAKERLEKQK